MAKTEKETESLKVPEYDDELNHVFFANKKHMFDDDKEEEEDLRIAFRNVYKAYFENRENLINEVRNIADESVNVKRNCNISYITGSSVGMAAGATAVVGTVVCPPLLIGGLVVAGLASVSNIGTHVTQFIIFRNLLKKVVRMARYDTELMRNLEEIYQKIVFSNLFEMEERERETNGVAEVAATTIAGEIPAIGLELGSGSAKGAMALGVRSVGLEMVEIGSGMLRGLARGALGIGIVIDGVTIIFSSSDLAKGSNTEFSEALRKFADDKARELLLVKKRIDSCGLIADPHNNL